jgi:translation elongation factor EF-1beta
MPSLRGREDSQMRPVQGDYKHLQMPKMREVRSIRGFMGKVAVIVKVFPESMEVFGEVKGTIEKEFKPYDIKEEEVAFGLKALKLTFLMDDKQGSGGIEEKLMKVKGVSEAQVEEVTLI